MTAHSQPHVARRLTPLVLTGVVGVIALLVAMLPANPAHGATQLVGTFRLTPGSCSGGKITGTHLRMILPSGGTSGPYMANADSPCSDQTFTPLRAGTDGGLVAGSYQATPNPPFDSKGNARAGRVTAPARYYGTGFATSTNATDPQTRTKVAPPRIYVDGTKLTGDLRAFSVTWNNQYFNQGAPKPNGSLPGNTRAPSGTYNPSTRAFTLNWTSTVVGGPFDKFTGQWHLEGTFVPAKGTSAPAASGSGSGTGSGAGTTGGTTAGGGTAAPGSPAAGGDAPAAEDGESVVDPETGEVLSTSAAATGVPTKTVVKETDLKVDPWLLALAIGIAVLGFGGLGALTWLGRRQEGER